MKTHRAAFESAFFGAAALWMSQLRGLPQYGTVVQKADAASDEVGISLAPLKELVEQNDFRHTLITGTDMLISLARELERNFDATHYGCFRIGHQWGNLYGVVALIEGSGRADLLAAIERYLQNVMSAEKAIRGLPQELSVTQFHSQSLSVSRVLEIVGCLAQWLEKFCEHAQVFVSYASEDSEIAHAIRDYLRKDGISCWLYEDDAKPGIPHLEQTGKSIDECTVVIVLISQHSLNSEFVIQEVFRTSEKAKPLIPVLVGLTYDELVRKYPKWIAPLGFRVAVEWSDNPEVLKKIGSSVKDLLASQ